MMVTRSMTKSTRAEVQEICRTDHARAAVRAWCPRGIFCKGFVPWTHESSIASASRGDMESVDLTEFLRFLWFCYDFSKCARAGILQLCDEKALGFLGFYVEIIENTMCLVGFRHERARVDFVVFFARDY